MAKNAASSAAAQQERHTARSSLVESPTEAALSPALSQYEALTPAVSPAKSEEPHSPPVDRPALTRSLKQSDDPLQMLRHCVTNQKKITHEGQWLYFDKLEAVHFTTKCAFRAKGADEEEELVDIGSVWFMYMATSADAHYTEEVCRKRDFKYIGIMIRGDLNEWLKGDRLTCAGVDMKLIDRKKRVKADSAATLNKFGPSESGQSKRARHESRLTLEDYNKYVHPVHQLNDYVCTGVAIPGVDEILAFTKDMLKNMDTPQVKDVLLKQWEEEHGGDDEVQSDAATSEDDDDEVRSTATTSADEGSDAEAPVKEVVPMSDWQKPEPEEQKIQRLMKEPLHVELENMMRQDPENLPIILVPCNKKAPVNMLNVQDFLQHGVYKKPDEQHLLCFESIRPEVIKITRNLGGKLWEFEVRDSIKRFTKQMWKRTVAVVLDGTDWQFRGWPFATVLDMLNTFKGIYFKEAGINLHEHVHEWACEKLDLPPLQLQHRFASVRDEFFILVGNWFNTHRQKRFVEHLQLKETIKAVRMKAIL